MWRNIRTVCFLVVAPAIGLAPPAMAGRPYGYGPYGPGYQGGYPATALPEPPTGAGTYGPSLPPLVDGSGGYAGRWSPRYSPETPLIPFPYGEPSQDASSPAPAAPGYGSRPHPPWGHPDSGGRGFGGSAGFRVSRQTADDAYILTIALDGMGPETVQVRTQGHWVLLSRTYSTRQTRKDSLDDGRGFIRSFSYSSGTTNRRLPVPPDAVLSAMSREDSADDIRLRIPRRCCRGVGKE